MSNVGNVWITTKLKDQATAQFKKNLGVMRNSALKFGASFGAFSALRSGINEISNAAEAQDSLNRLIGKDGVAALEKYAKTSVNTMGMSRGQLLETANNFAGLFGVIPKGALNTGEAIGALEQRVADLGSQFTKSNEEISTGLQSALSGRISLTLQQMGIYLNQTSMETRMAAGEFAKFGFAADRSFASLTEGEKVLLRYQAFMAQSAGVTNNFADTAGISLPNQLKIMKAQLVTSAAEISKTLMPALMKIIPMISDLVQWLAKASDWIIGLGKLFALFKVTQFLVSMGKAIKALYVFAVAKAGAMGGIAGAVTAGLVAAGLSEILVGIGGDLFSSGGSGSSGVAAQKSSNTTFIHVSGGATVDSVRSNDAGHNVQTVFGRGE